MLAFACAGRKSSVCRSRTDLGIGAPHGCQEAREAFEHRLGRAAAPSLRVVKWTGRRPESRRSFQPVINAQYESTGRSFERPVLVGPKSQSRFRMGSARRLSFRCAAAFRCLLLRRCPVGEAIPVLPADVQSAASVLSQGKRTIPVVFCARERKISSKT